MIKYTDISFKEYNNLINKKGAYRILEEDNNYMQYVVDGEVHRKDNPAVIWKDGGVTYFNYGKIHRTNGPAMIDEDGETSFYIKGEELTKERFLQRLSKRQLKQFILNPNNF